MRFFVYFCKIYSNSRRYRTRTSGVVQSFPKNLRCISRKTGTLPPNADCPLFWSLRLPAEKGLAGGAGFVEAAARRQIGSARKPLLPAGFCFFGKSRHDADEAIEAFL